MAPIPLPALGDALDDQPPLEHSRQALERAAETARGYVQRLEADPNDTAVREKLARLMAERLNQPENAIEQLQLLLEVPEQPEAKHAEWLSLIAAWQIKHLEDPEQGRITLERLIRQYPKTPQSIAARRRIQLMDRELKSQG
jgi:tetratricopeptide (TPR) repeat protein